MSLHYLVKLEMLIICAANELLQKKKLRIYATSTVAAKFVRVECSWLQSVGLQQEKVYKTCITDLYELKQQLRTEWAKLDYVIVAAAIRQWRRW